MPKVHATGGHALKVPEGRSVVDLVSRWLVIRRFVDRGLAMTLLVLLSPLVTLAAMFVWLADRRPPIIWLWRVGRYGRPFRMWKIRSMCASSSDGSAFGPSLTASNDQRITRVGHYLRRWRLDELPQLWNVVRGEMMLIGPRPEVPEFVDIKDPRWASVLTSPPGIAGPTQVLIYRWEASVLLDGSSEKVYRTEILPVKLAVDQWYIQSASLAIDLSVLIDILLGFSRRGKPYRVLRRARTRLPVLDSIPDCWDSSPPGSKPAHPKG